MHFVGKALGLELSYKVEFDSGLQDRCNGGVLLATMYCACIVPKFKIQYFGLIVDHIQTVRMISW